LGCRRIDRCAEIEGARELAAQDRGAPGARRERARPLLARAAEEGAERSAGEHRLQITYGTHGDAGELQSGLLDHRGYGQQLFFVLVDTLHHDFQHGLRAALLGQNAIAVQLLQPVLLPWIEVADEYLRCDEAQPIEPCDRGIDLLGRQPQADRRHGFP